MGICALIMDICTLNMNICALIIDICTLNMNICALNIDICALNIKSTKVLNNDYLDIHSDKILGHLKIKL